MATATDRKPRASHPQKKNELVSPPRSWCVPWRGRLHSNQQWHETDPAANDERFARFGTHTLAPSRKIVRHFLEAPKQRAFHRVLFGTSRHEAKKRAFCIFVKQSQSHLFFPRKRDAEVPSLGTRVLHGTKEHLFLHTRIEPPNFVRGKGSLHQFVHFASPLEKKKVPGLHAPCKNFFCCAGDGVRGLA